VIQPIETPKSSSPSPAATIPNRLDASTHPPKKGASKITRHSPGCPNGKGKPRGRAASPYFRHAVEKALRIPRAILEQNAGKDCSDSDAAKFIGLSLSGATATEISSALKYGFLTRPAAGKLQVTDRAKRVFRPQQPVDSVAGLREALLAAPVLADVYRHYRGENLPDPQFFDNTLTDTFGVPTGDVNEFKAILLESLRSAQLIDEQASGKARLLDVSQQVSGVVESPEELQRLAKTARATTADSCFVLMPFAEPLGSHFSLIYEPAIRRAGLRAVRADADIFATGKIMDQVWSGINAARVLVAEMTTRNPNVFYELGIAHAIQKPVVLISSNEEDVPFDVRHIRVIYYDVNDPFWGEKLINKVAENIVSALKNPDEAIFRRGKT